MAGDAARRAVCARQPQRSLPPAGRLGAPLGISLAGPHGSDRSLIALAGALAAGA
jgi:amidase